MNDKYSAIDYFVFINRICARGGCSKCTLRICGVLFIGNSAYCTTNDIVGEVKINDNVKLDHPVFWSYDRDGEMDKLLRDKFLLNVKGYLPDSDVAQEIIKSGFYKNFNSFLNKTTDNDFYIRRSDILSIIDSYNLTDAQKNKLKVELRPNFEGIDLRILKIRDTTVVDLEVSFFIYFFTRTNSYNKIKFTNDVCVVNLYYLYEILDKGFDNKSTVRIKYSKNLPLIILRKDHASFAVSQIMS